VDRPSVLCLGTHSDDIEIGAGAAVLVLRFLNGIGSEASQSLVPLATTVFERKKKLLLALFGS
jgi:hypothetical protein